MLKRQLFYINKTENVEKIENVTNVKNVFTCDVRCAPDKATMTTWSAVTLCLLVVVAHCLLMTSSMPRRITARRWYVGGRPIKPSPGVRVRVSPRSATMHYGDAVSFRCVARGGSTIIDMPHIRFSVISPVQCDLSVSIFTRATLC